MKQLFSRTELTVSLLLLLLFSAGCKKYPDGPLISFESKKERVMGTWDVVSYQVNGYDSTSVLKNKSGYDMLWFGKGTHDLGYLPLVCGSYSGEWKFTNNKKNLDMSFRTYSNMPQPALVGAYRAVSISWEIRKLTDKEMWMRTTYNGSDYFLKLSLFKDY